MTSDLYVFLQCNTEHKNVFLHIPGLKITQIKIPRNVVDVFGTLTTCFEAITNTFIFVIMFIIQCQSSHNFVQRHINHASTLSNQINW
jgi:hypothetical protein